MNAIERYSTKSPLALVIGSSLLLSLPATGEECSSPCTITRAGLPTLRLINTVPLIPDWDLETSAFGVELAPESDAANIGAFRVEHDAVANGLVIDSGGGVGIGTSAPVLGVELQINDVSPQIRLDDISAGQGRVDLLMSGNNFSLQGNADQTIMFIDTRAPNGLWIHKSGRVRLGDFNTPDATLHVAGDAIVEGDVALGSSRSLKTSFGAVSSSEILARLTELPVVSWRYKTEEEGIRHIGPFAEDFQRLFGMGNGETISIVDAQGVAFAALQGLAENQAALEREIAEKNSRIAELTDRWVEQRTYVLERLEGLERRIASLSEVD